MCEQDCLLWSALQVIRILKELKQKYPDKELDQLVELANYYALLHQQKSRAFYRVQVMSRTPAEAAVELYKMFFNLSAFTSIINKL